MNSQALVAEFANRPSGFWSYMTHEALADWVTRADGVPQPFGALPSAGPHLPGLIQAINDADAKSLREIALGVAGMVVRTCVPAAAESAGQHWLLTPHANKLRQWFRLTVGMCWAAEISYFDDGRLTAAFRMADSPVRRAIDEGSLRVEDLAKFGIATRPDGLRTFADDAAVYHCPDIDGLLWFLDQPAFGEAIRLMNARLVSTGQFAFHKHYDPNLADEAWAAAEALSLPDPLEIIPARPVTRPHTDGPQPGAFPEWPPADAQSLQKARDEHDRLLVLLMTKLNEAGIRPFELRSPWVDLAWRTADGQLHIAEAKTALGPSEEDRLRLGLGQILDYRHRLTADGPRPTAYLLVSQVDDPTWHAIFGDAGVRLLTATDSDDWRLN